jgi:hypothetical protein
VIVVTVAQRPELVEPSREQTADTMPEYNMHGDVLNAYWPRLTRERPDFQFHIVDEHDAILARARSVPLRWDGSLEDLPAGIDGAIARGFEEGWTNVLCALLVMVPLHVQSRGISSSAIAAMREIAEAHGFESLIAPVRPSIKERYPLVPIERYATWRRADGFLFDPWMRVHERLGATILRAEPQSLRITGTVGEWEDWTASGYPTSGSYSFPGGLAALEIDRSRDVGSYWEPNVWMQHEL